MVKSSSPSRQVFMLWSWILLAAVSGAWAVPEYMIDNFNTVQSGTAGTGSEPFMVFSERYGCLDLTYHQTDGFHDIAWWEGLSWSWQLVNVSSYRYMLLDVRGGSGGEDFTVEFHYKDAQNRSHKPWVRISDYGPLTPSWRTVSIPIEDFRGFDPMRALAIALGFRYPTCGPASVSLDNIGLSLYPASFFWTQRAVSVSNDAARFTFKAHHPSGQAPCSGVTLHYSVNNGPTTDVAMSQSGSSWLYTAAGLANGDQVDYSFGYACISNGMSDGFHLTHRSTIDNVIPSTPQGLTGVGVSPTRIDLRWTASSDNVGVVGYRIYRNDVEIGTSATTNYSSMGLNQNTSYSYFIRALDAFNNESDVSSAIAVATPKDVTPPSMPVGFTGEVTSAATVFLSWQSATDNVAVTAYRVLRDGVDYGLSYTTSLVTYGQSGCSHTFAVVACDDGGNRSPTSELLQVIMPYDTMPPGAPQNFAATPSSPIRIDLSWSPSIDNGWVTGYEVFMNGSYIGTTARTNYQAGGLSPDTTYSFTARAVDSVGLHSEYSDEVTATTPGGMIEPLGSYAAEIPWNVSRPTISPYITTNMTRPLPTHDWWTSIMTVRNSGMLSAKPFAYYARGWQVECAYPRVQAYSDSIEAPFTTELGLSAAGGTFPVQNAGASRVDGYGDFSVRVRLGDTNSFMDATLVRGSPYTYLIYSNCVPMLNCPAGYNVVTANTTEAYLVIRSASANQSVFAFFAPSGTLWNTSSGTQILPALPLNKRFLSVAVMTGRGTSFNAEEFNRLRAHAYAFVTNTHVDFAYHPEQGRVCATYSCETVPMQGGETETLMGLLPLHWKNSMASLVPGMVYTTILGALKLHEGNSWTMGIRFGGIVPELPKPTDETWSDSMFATLAQDCTEFNGTIGPTYWYGVELGRATRALLALDAAGRWEDRDALLGQIRAGLENLFTYSPGESQHFFGYESVWGSLLGFSESFGATTYLNDHHFHFGYFVYAAAIVAMFDPSFAVEYREIVDKILRDYNNPSRDVSGPEPLPWLRHFDPWEGHCWATGLPAPEGDDASAWGPDQESTSEAMNSWAAMFLWGEVTHNPEFRDMGAIGYAIEAQAIREYWYDADQSNHPTNYPKTMISRVFAGKLDTRTWFDQHMDAIWGIQYVPVGPHMTYLGEFRDYRILDYNYFKQYVPPASVRDGWKAVHWMYRSFFEPNAVVAEYDSHVTLDGGNSHAAVYYMIHALRSLGQVDTSVYSDCPTLVAWAEGARTNYVAFNNTVGAITARVFRVCDNALVGRVVLRNQRTTLVATDSDGDGDGLCNGVEMGLGTDLFLRDSDGDGQDDRCEVVAGMNALDPASVFTMSAEGFVQGDAWRLTWPGQTARTYRVMAFPSIAELLAGTNGALLADGVTGTGTVAQQISLPIWTTGVMRISVTPSP
jgi:endoglucanase Acf2